MSVFKLRLIPNLDVDLLNEVLPETEIEAIIKGSYSNLEGLEDSCEDLNFKLENI